MFATCTAVPLLTAFDVITAVRLPTLTGLVEKVTVSAVAVAAVTVPTAPLLKTMVLLPATGLNPKPLITIVVAVRARLVVLDVMTGLTVATRIAVPLDTPLVVTMAVRLPAVVGRVDNVTVSDVAVAEVTVPTAPLLNTTMFSEAVASKPVPAIVIEVALASKFVVLRVTTGARAAT